MRLHQLVLILPVALGLLAACGEKKKTVTQKDFESTSKYLSTNMNGSKFPTADKIAYVKGQLGAPHRVDGEKLYWYTVPSDCNYFKFDTSDSWGTAQKADCEKYAPK